MGFAEGFMLTSTALPCNVQPKASLVIKAKMSFKKAEMKKIGNTIYRCVLLKATPPPRINTPGLAAVGRGGLPDIGLGDGEGEAAGAGAGAGAEAGLRAAELGVEAPPWDKRSLL